jgi:hypothetical protein
VFQAEDFFQGQKKNIKTLEVRVCLFVWSRSECEEIVEQRTKKKETNKEKRTTNTYTCELLAA